MLLSRFDKNLPRILIASTRKPVVASIPIIVSTHSYRIAFPAFLFDSVFEATCRKKFTRGKQTPIYYEIINQNIGNSKNNYNL